MVGLVQRQLADGYAREPSPLGADVGTLAESEQTVAQRPQVGGVVGERAGRVRDRGLKTGVARDVGEPGGHLVLGSVDEVRQHSAAHQRLQEARVGLGGNPCDRAFRRGPIAPSLVEVVLGEELGGRFVCGLPGSHGPFERLGYLFAADELLIDSQCLQWSARVHGDAGGPERGGYAVGRAT